MVIWDKMQHNNEIVRSLKRPRNLVEKKLSSLTSRVVRLFVSVYPLVPIRFLFRLVPLKAHVEMSYSAIN